MSSILIVLWSQLLKCEYYMVSFSPMTVNGCGKNKIFKGLRLWKTPIDIFHHVLTFYKPNNGSIYQVNLLLCSYVQMLLSCVMYVHFTFAWLQLYTCMCLPVLVYSLWKLVCMCLFAQVWSWPVQGPCQSEAAVHTLPGPGERTPGLPAHSEHMQWRLHLWPLCCTTQRAAWETEPAGELRQYPYCCIISVLSNWRVSVFNTFIVTSQPLN